MDIDKQKRVVRYFEKVERFLEVQSIVYRPSYKTNLDYYGSDLWLEHEELNNFLRKEADNLFFLGINVYK